MILGIRARYCSGAFLFGGIDKLNDEIYTKLYVKFEFGGEVEND